MPDAQFTEPRLAAIYDAIDDDRSDLDHYVDVVEEHRARSILDVGCGTGTLACRLAILGLDVTGVEPALASLQVAKKKPNADRVNWIHGTTNQLPMLAVDMTLMTGNVAQVFLHDDDWTTALTDIRAALCPTGHLVFETRDPQRRGWEEWTTDQTQSTADIAGVGQVEYSADLIDVSLPFVTFRWTYRFVRDGVVLTSNSTLRFRQQDELRTSLEQTGFSVREVRDAPDRPGRELVFIAQAVD